MEENQPELSTANTSTNRSRQVVEISQPAENTGFTLVSSVLTGENYLVWSRAIRFALGSRKKLSFIDGRSVRPADDSDELDEWIRIDYMVITWILNTVSKEIVDAFIYVSSARSLWLDLEARYGGSNGPMIYNLEREIGSVSQGNMSVTAYFTKIKMLWDELVCLDPVPACACPVHRQIMKREDSRQLMRFLMGLNNTYEHVRSQILLMEPRPHVQKAFSMVLSVEKQLSVQVQQSIGTAGAIYQVHHKDMKHKGIIDKRSMICDYCKRTGHLKEACFKLNGTPEWYKELAEKKKKGAGRGRGMIAAVDVDPQTTVSGLQGNDFSSILRAEIRKFMTENGSSHPQYNTPFDDVQINFAHMAELEESAVLHSVADTSANDNSVIWHQRLGHVSVEALKHIPSINVKKLHVSHPCDVCHLAKQQRLPFPNSDSQVTSVFDLVHIDIWGPYKQPTPSNCSYFLTIVDHYSRSTWTHLLQFKSQAIDYLCSFITLTQTQFGKTIKIIRSDNGSEFLSIKFQTFLQQHGILHQRSCAYTPQQNGVVEHKHKHLLTMARSLLFQASLPDKFWGDCILAATYIINRTPSQLLNWSTPYQLLFNKPPSYSHFRVFGCLCYATNVKPSKSKFDPRSFKCIFVGYPPGQKGFKLFNLESQSYFVSRDVQFYEHVFPYSNSASSTFLVLCL
ncbi:UNVERIFIED_CONTAM: hypothetical protein Sradi_3100200 [Sesamum radiatum]|uniref:Integrase catalytic domain-containing protein n=1 Tax=Sesamum radiatum TaxID=300843 RepID=A0AAW2RCQ3_SESRA